MMLRTILIASVALLLAMPCAWAANDTTQLAQPAPVQMQQQQRDGLVGKIRSALMNLLHQEPQDLNAANTLVAPFAESTALPAAPGERNIMRLSTNTAALDQPHRSSADLGEWLMQALSEALSFTSDNYADRMKMMAKGMNSDALLQFNSWSTGSGILASLQANGLQLNGFVEEKPFLLNEGAVAGRYRWLYEIPVLVSFVPRGTTSLDQQTGVDSRRLLITLQVGRVEKSDLPDHVMIESWSVKDNTRKN